MSTTSTNLISALGAGSGVDVKALAQNLVDAEKTPLKEAIDKKITKSEARISGYGAVSFVVGEIKKKFAALDDLGDFSKMTVSNSQSAALSVSTGATAKSGSHSIEVLALATAQRRLSGSYAASNTPLNSGQAFNLALTVGSGSAQTIAVSAANATPAGVVSAINSANLGVQAQLVNTGDPVAPFQITVTGQTGAANAFTLSSDIVESPGNLGIGFVQSLQDAANASVKVNGVTLSRSNNKIDDAITGVTLNLNGLTTGSSSLSLSRDTPAVKTKLQELVAAYNDMDSVLKDVSNPDSKIEGYGATLVGDSLVQQVRSQVRSIFSGTSSTPGTRITALRDLGISITREGTMALDETKLDKALESDFDDMLKMLSQNRTVPTTLRSLPSGLAGDAVKKLDDMIGSNGVLVAQAKNSQTQITQYKAELTKLDSRMAQVLERYTQQFSLMESMVGQTNAMKTNLKSTFEGMMAQYTNS